MNASTPDIDKTDREPVLDGIRGLAIALVLYHHFVLYSGLWPDVRIDFHLHRIGHASWLGVDLFFVLSGFLITGILYEAKASQHYFRNFYARRTLRIFPLYYAFLAGSFLVLPLFLAPATGSAVTAGQAWYWLYLSNIDVALHGWPEPVHFGHFWSLAVEEQFYLVWPLVVYAFGRVALLRISVLCFAGALALRFAVPLWLDPLANYVLMPTRMDAFAAGAAVALLMRAPGGLRRLGAWPKIVLFVALAILAALYQWKKGLKVHEPLVHTYGFSLIALAVAALIAVALTAREGSWLRRALSCAALTTLGKYSYALYVFHQPVLAILRDHGLGSGMLPRLWGSQLPGLLAFGAIGFALSMLCALLSWRLIEAPFLRLKRRLPTAGGALPTSA